MIERQLRKYMRPFFGRFLHFFPRKLNEFRRNNRHPVEREKARIRGEQELWIEPPVMEYISAKLYALAGDADLRLPRALAILFWLIGAAGLNRICRGWLSDVGRAAAFALYLLLPYGVLVSRSFQPEALMTALTIFALATLGGWTERRSWGAAILTAVFAGAAVYVKQVMIFPIGFALGGFPGASSPSPSPPDA